jgi:hypothetical protein
MQPQNAWGKKKKSDEKEATTKYKELKKRPLMKKEATPECKGLGIVANCTKAISKTEK